MSIIRLYITAGDHNVASIGARLVVVVLLCFLPEKGGLVIPIWVVDPPQPPAWSIQLRSYFFFTLVLAAALKIAAVASRSTARAFKRAVSMLSSPF